MIYEGTNQIQAIDLLVRKVAADGGRRFESWLDDLRAGLPAGGALVEPVREGIETMRGETRALLAAAHDDAELPFRVADDFLRSVGLLLVGHAWARADALSSRPEHAADPWHAAKRSSARHCADHVWPEFGQAIALLRAGRKPLAAIEVLAA
jgi:hypothetical protein